MDPKAREAAEGYLLARYQLYSTIYYHKTTRSAEKILALFLREIAERIGSSGSFRRKLGTKSVALDFLGDSEPSLETYLAMDDTTIWTLVSEVRQSTDRELKELGDLAGRLIERKLFKAFDLSRRAEASNSAAVDFVHELKQDAQDVGLVWGKTLIEDRPRQKGYDWYDWDTQSTLKKVLVRDKEHNGNEDIVTGKQIGRAHV